MDETSSEDRKLRRLSRAHQARVAASGVDEPGAAQTGPEDAAAPRRRRPKPAKPPKPARPRRSWLTRLTWFACKGLLTLAMLLVLVAGAFFMAVEAGALDKTLKARAEGALNGAVGPRYLAKVGNTAIRFAHNRQLAIEARNVEMVDQETGRSVSQTGAIRMALDPFQLISGVINITRIEADNVRFDTALFAGGNAFDAASLRIDALPSLVEAGFAQLDLFGGFVDRARTDTLEVNGMQLMAAGADGKTAPLGSARFTVTRTAEGSMNLDGTVSIEDDMVPFSVIAERKLGKAVSLTATVSGIPLQRLGPPADKSGRARDILDAAATVEITATRHAATVEPAIELSVTANPGTLRVHEIEQKFDGASIKAVYDFDKNSLEFLPSSMRFGDTSLPFTGGLIDLDRLPNGSGKGFGVDFLVQGGKVSTEGAAAPPLDVDAQASGRYLTDSNELVLDKLAASTRIGALIGSLKLKFGGAEPEISFAAQTDNAQTQAVKQLWPFWIAPKARHWVAQNLFGGTVTNGQIAAFLPAERVRNTDGSLVLNDDQLHISFDVSNARLNIAGDIPPVRGTAGHFELKGRTVRVDLKSGTSYFPTDRSVNIDGGTFSIPDIEQHPLMAEMDIGVSGAADAVAELITYRPIKFLSKTGLTPADVAGNIRAQVQARFGLNSADEVKPTWKAGMTLVNVDLLKPYQGRRLTALSGTLDIDPDKAILASKGKLDGVPVELAATEPVGEASTVKRQRTMSVTANGDELDKLFPSIDQVLDGTVRAKVELREDDLQKVDVDLAQAVLKVPGTGWTKGAGIPARATFTVSHTGETTDIRDFAVSGEGFGLTGNVQTRAGKLVLAAFDKVKLAANDNFSLRVKPIRSGYDVSVSGASIDARAAMDRMRSAGTRSAQGSKMTLAIRAKLDTVFGFGDEKLSSVDLAYSPFTNGNGKLQLSAVSSRGQPVVGQVVSDAKGQFIQFTTGDAGASFRFLGLYSRLQKGLMNLRLRPGPNGSWSGNIDIRDFQLANEERLQTIVSTPTGRDGRSLNNAVKRDIDVRSEKFQRAFAYFSYADGALDMENGVLRGEQVGATFQGTVRDQAGRMDVTGTFMPAYGLNRLFAELPIIGILLGNGRDRGLLGITFKLTGPFEKPNLAINPLSIIAPGIFRQIFEFQ